MKAGHFVTENFGPHFHKCSCLWQVRYGFYVKRKRVDAFSLLHVGFARNVTRYVRITRNTLDTRVTYEVKRWRKHSNCCSQNYIINFILCTDIYASHTYPISSYFFIYSKTRFGSLWSVYIYTHIKEKSTIPPICHGDENLFSLLLLNPISLPTKWG